MMAELLGRDGFEVVGVGRDSARVSRLLDSHPLGSEGSALALEEFPAEEFDAVVNCLGVGSPAAVAAAGKAVIELTEYFDRIALDYIEANPETRYVAFSSGAAYGGDFSEPASRTTRTPASSDGDSETEYYGLSKRQAEARHRAASELAIVDLRLFGLFSRYADLSAGYFMCDVYRAIASGEVVQVGPENIVRDYVSPADLAALVVAALDAAPHNDVFDVYSAAPVSKFDALERFAREYGLKYDVLGEPSVAGATGLKPNYYSTNERAASLGYAPSRTSLQTLTEEIDALLGPNRDGLA
ncbi:MAG: NAD-dependent epimerase/dehydratase family protein [Coriobacteriia bacterium]|nr:NAD-dependent epimerase/dehydratase family protein [Coriobacteriia bacterium]